MMLGKHHVVAEIAQAREPVQDGEHVTAYGITGKVPGNDRQRCHRYNPARCIRLPTTRSAPK